VTKDGGGAGWWTEAFRRSYLDCYSHRDDASAEREAAFVATALGLAPGARLLDAGCGAGRHVRAFTRRGASVVGVDLSQELLAEAVAAGDARYVAADVRALPFKDGAFAHVVSLFTSFGYFDDDGDRAQLAELHRVLRHGGTFVIDFLNPSHVIGSLVPTSSRTVGLYEIQETRFLREGRIEKEVAVKDTAAGTTRTWKESVRLYGRKDLEILLTGAGFKVASVHGDLAGGAWSDASTRLVLTAVAA
jgi:SAM-dependent methyltransferase